MIPLVEQIAKGMPSYVILFITDKCGAKCNHCFFKNSLNRGIELDIAALRKISKTIGKVYHVNLTGGEPFLRKDLPAIAQLFYDHANTRSFGIPTNGFSRKKICTAAKGMVHKCAGSNIHISISIDGLRAVHDKSRGVKGLFDSAMDTFRGLKNIKHITTGFNLVVSETNADAVEETYGFLKIQNPDMITVLLDRTGLDRGTYKTYNRLVKIWSKDIAEGVYPGYGQFSKILLARDVVTRKIISRGVPGKCVAGKHACVIYNDGEVRPCEILNHSYGNLRDYDFDFRALWIKREDEVGRCFCTHECFQGLNSLFYKKKEVFMQFAGSCCRPA